MGKSIKHLLWLLIVFSLFSFAGCDSSQSGAKEEDSKPELTFISYNLELYDSFQLICKNMSVTFSSADEQIATVDANGIVTAVGEGSVDIMAASNKNSSVCRVNVRNYGILPVIKTNTIDIVNLNLNQKINLNGKVSFKNVERDNTVSYSCNNDVLSVSASGEVVALKHGSAIITLNAVFSQKAIQKQITFNVIPDVAISLEKYNFNIATDSCFNDATSFTLSPVVLVDGEVVISPEIRYDFDETVIQKQDNTFSAIANKDTSTIIEVSFEESGFKTTVPITVNVFIPNLDKTSQTVFVDNWKDSERNITLHKDEYTFNYEFEDGKSIVSVIDISDVERVDLEYNNGVLGATRLDKGSYTWRIYNEKYSETVKVKVVDKVIYTAEEFRIMTAKATNEYLVIGCDIQNVGMCINEGNVFSGILDGNYHTVSGVVIGDRDNPDVEDLYGTNSGEIADRRSKVGGIFYEINGALIENISFVNSKISVAQYLPETPAGLKNAPVIRSGRAFLAYRGTNSEILNVNLEMENLSGKSESGLCFYLREGLKIQNVVIICKDEVLKYAPIAFHKGNRVEFDNLYVLSLYNFGFADADNWNFGNSFTIFKDIKDLKTSLIDSNFSDYIKSLYKSGDIVIDDDFI